MNWTKLPPLEKPQHKGCLTCGPLVTTLNLGRELSVGFGNVEVTRDGLLIWSGDDENKRVQEFEELARTDPDHDYRIKFNNPLYDATYQRQDNGQWILVEKGEGFA